MPYSHNTMSTGLCTILHRCALIHSLFFTAPMEVCVHNTTVYQVKWYIASCVHINKQSVLALIVWLCMTTSVTVSVLSILTIALQSAFHIIKLMKFLMFATNRLTRYGNHLMTNVWNTSERVDGNSMTVEIKTTCPAFNPENCIPVSGLKETILDNLIS